MENLADRISGFFVRHTAWFKLRTCADFNLSNSMFFDELDSFDVKSVRL